MTAARCAAGTLVQGYEGCLWWDCRRLVPVSMGIVMFVLGLAVPLLIREPGKGRYTPANKARTYTHFLRNDGLGALLCIPLWM